MRIFAGYDPKESIAYHVCCNSLIRHSTKPLAITPLALNNLNYREGQRQTIEGYPPTNQFIFSRFLIPHLMDYKGWALFIDGDMIVTDDISKLFAMADESKAVQVAQGAGAIASIASLFSDARLKENIVPAGRENGHNIYEFNYIGQPERYTGVMAQEVLETNPEAVIHTPEGLKVNYSAIGVQMKRKA